MMIINETDYHKSRIYELRKQRFDADGREATGFYASSLGTCPRKQVLKRLNVKTTNKPTVEGMGKMDMGKKIEEFHIQELKDAGFKVEDYRDGEQIRITIGDVSGRLDALVEGFPYEIKSQQSRAFWHKKKGDPISRAHQFQIIFYMVGLEVVRGTVAYISKDDQTIMELDVNLTEDDRRMLNDRMQFLTDVMKREELPQAKPDEEWECSSKWCPYYSLCKLIGFGRIPFAEIENKVDELNKLKAEKS